MPTTATNAPEIAECHRHLIASQETLLSLTPGSCISPYSDQLGIKKNPPTAAISPAVVVTGRGYPRNALSDKSQGQETCPCDECSEDYNLTP